MTRRYTIIIISTILFFAGIKTGVAATNTDSIIVGAAQIPVYLPLLQQKNIALVVNQTSVVANSHLVDTLKKLGCNIQLIFALEHGFRGDADAGEELGNSVDAKTGIPIFSLYGKSKKPSPESLQNIDIVLFDIQDVGARFYTYLTTLHYVMEACAEQKKPLLLLDRPNPNGFYIDGPVLDTAFSSFVGLHPVPIVYGMTIGEYATMINGERWLRDSVQCNLQVIRMQKYTHKSRYVLPIKPSPNLNSQQAIYLYPSLCLFEGTVISMGRGTTTPFQLIGHPKFDSLYAFSFTPKSIPGMSKNPPYEDKACHGINLQRFNADYFYINKQLNLNWLIELYNQYPDKERFFNPFFDNLAGTNQLRKQLKEGYTAAQIRENWQPQLNKFKKVRSYYLLYP